MLDFDVGQRGEAARAPVDDAFGPVDQPVVIEPLENRANGVRQPVVHREALARPVDAFAEPAHLAQDATAVFGFHCHTRSTNASRPRSWREMPSLPSSRSTTFWVAMPAWSMPGSHSASYPCMRRRRITASISVCCGAWPMCSWPVTFGRRQHDRERRALAGGVGGEVPAVEPTLVELRFDRCGRVLRRQLGRRRRAFGRGCSAFVRAGRDHLAESRERDAGRPNRFAGSSYP